MHTMTVFMHKSLDITILMSMILLLNCRQNKITITATLVQWSNGLFNARF